MLTIVGTVILFVPLDYLFSRIGLNWFWFTFPATELLTTAVGLVYYRQFINDPYPETEKLFAKK